jgi:hypothetical protein
MFEEDARILEKIAGQYAEGSSEYEALKHAAIALFYVLSQCHEQFSNYWESFHGDLTEEQKRHLRAMGIDPDRDPGGSL